MLPSLSKFRPANISVEFYDLSYILKSSENHFISDIYKPSFNFAFNTSHRNEIIKDYKWFIHPKLNIIGAIHQMGCALPWSSNPWVISCPITIPIPPKFRAWSCFSLKNGGCKMPAGNTETSSRRRKCLMSYLIMIEMLLLQPFFCKKIYNFYKLFRYMEAIKNFTLKTLN